MAVDGYCGGVPKEGAFVGVSPMAVKKWLQIAGLPNGNHADSGIREDSPLYCRVAAAILPDGSRIRISGHGRAAAWANGSAEYIPLCVWVDWYSIPNIDSAADLASQLARGHI